MSLIKSSCENPLNITLILNDNSFVDPVNQLTNKKCYIISQTKSNHEIIANHKSMKYLSSDIHFKIQISYVESYISINSLTVRLMGKHIPNLTNYKNTNHETIYSTI